MGSPLMRSIVLASTYRSAAPPSVASRATISKSPSAPETAVPTSTPAISSRRPAPPSAPSPSAASSSRPSLRTTSNVTTLPANGVTPSGRKSCTRSGSASQPCITALCPLPETILICGLPGGIATRDTVIASALVFPSPSAATASICRLPASGKGRSGRKNVPFVPMPTSTAAGCPLTRTSRPW